MTKIIKQYFFPTKESSYTHYIRINDIFYRIGDTKDNKEKFIRFDEQQFIIYHYYEMIIVDDKVYVFSVPKSFQLFENPNRQKIKQLFIPELNNYYDTVIIDNELHLLCLTQPFEKPVSQEFIPELNNYYDISNISHIQQLPTISKRKVLLESDTDTLSKKQKVF